MSCDTSVGVTVVVDDDESAADALCELLSSVRTRVRAFPSAEALLAAGVPRDADCLVIDMGLGPSMDGIALVERLRRGGDRTPVVMIADHPDLRHAIRAIRAGAADLMERPRGPEQLLEAVDSAVRRCAAERRAAMLIGSLTPREREVLVALVSGKSNKEVARDLAISVRTAEAHRAAIMTKLEATSLVHLVRLSLLAGIVA
jgi:two-component system response regulator FixJ